MLDTQLLEELEDRWREQSPAVLQRMQPGIDDDEIDRLSAPLGYTIPEELRRWYRWHNGSTGSPIIISRCFSTLSDDVAATLDFEADEEKWKKGWLQVMDEKPLMIFDCRGGVSEPVPVWHFDYAFDFPTRPVFESIGDMVSFWIELIDDGHVSWDAGGEEHIRQPVPEAILERISGVRPTEPDRITPSFGICNSGAEECQCSACWTRSC
jgi:hypothetical protein